MGKDYQRISKAHEYFTYLSNGVGDHLTPETSRTQSPVSLCEVTDPLLAVPPGLNQSARAYQRKASKGPEPGKDRRVEPTVDQNTEGSHCFHHMSAEELVLFLGPETLRESGLCGR